MRVRIGRENEAFMWAISIGIPLLLFWAILMLRIPYLFSQYFFSYSFGLFVILLASYYFTFRLSGKYGIVAGFCLTMLLFAMTLSYKWTSAFSDNGIIGGLVPYKDGKNYYLGANLILNGHPLIHAGQSTERPLFPGLLSTTLLFTNQDLKLALAILVQLAAIGSYLSARHVLNSFGALSAATYATLSYFYIQPWIGFAMSELMGFTMGCLAFVILWHAARAQKWFDLVLGLLALMVAVSARAGAFLVFPLLLLWSGWVFRRSERFSIGTSVYVAVIILAGYFLVNTVYARLMGIPEGAAFGNFSYALYGQVRGGTGWHSAIEELGTRSPSIVFQAALQFFLAHPLSLLIGFGKAYRDFFLPGFAGIFPFGTNGQLDWLTYAAWSGCTVLLAAGLVSLARNIRSNLDSLLLLSFIGIFISIPFLPPIDGGSRFYASTMPLFFAVCAVALRSSGPDAHPGLESPPNYTLLFIRSGVIMLMTLTMVVPVLTYHLSANPLPETPACAFGREPFVIITNPGSYINVVPDATENCGLIPTVCMGDFEKNGTQKTVDDFFQKLLSLAQSSRDGLRIMPAINLLDAKFHYFVSTSSEILFAPSGQVISGCATEIRTASQSIYWMDR